MDAPTLTKETEALLLGQETARKGDWALVKSRIKSLRGKNERLVGENRQLVAQLAAVKHIAAMTGLELRDTKRQLEIARRELLEVTSLQESFCEEVCADAREFDVACG